MNHALPTRPPPAPVPFTRRGAIALLAAGVLTAGCQTPPAADRRARFTPAQVMALQSLGFHPDGDDWSLDLATGLLFEFDSDRLQPGQVERLARIASTLSGVDVRRMHVEGHTDNVGASGYNQALSLRRAASVARTLATAGFDAAGLQVRGLGAARPIADNGSEAGRAQNRRVTLIVVAD